MAARNLLVELLVEELPPKALLTLGESFCSLLTASLDAQGLRAAESVATSFATPRRLAAHVTNVADRAADKSVQQKLMPATVGLDSSGQPTAALIKRLAALGVDPSAISKVRRVPDGKGEALFIDITQRGATLTEGLQKALDTTLAEIPIPTRMNYQLDDGWTSVTFVRPAHGLVALHGDEVVPVSALGVAAGRITRGHRFEAARSAIDVRDADTYAQQLETEGAVIASYTARRADIARQLEAAATSTGLTPIEDEALLNEVTALVEWPNVLVCQFEKEFLEVPQECLILTMKANQKYFPLLDAGGKLSNRFLVVSNIRPADSSRVIEGNERVVRPRLADAKFFFDQDRKRPLNSHLEGLARVVYHNKLGSQLDRVRRLEQLAKLALTQVPAASDRTRAVEAAAKLCKCDLLTLMVGEFPELQGIMGCYYAKAEGLAEDIAEAIREHYLPRGAGDALPETDVGIALAIADKLDTIVGVFAIDQKPTGTRDPFGVRRAAIGLLRIAVESKVPLDLIALTSKALELQPLPTSASIAAEVYDYIMERLRAYYVEGGGGMSVTIEMFDAVLANRPVSPLDFDRRLRALHEFLKLSDAQSLAAANKRISNILRKSGKDSFGPVSADLLRDTAELALNEQIVAMKKVTEPLFAARDYTRALTKLAELRPAVDAFFDGVMVMADDQALQQNRLALLAQLRGLFARVADLSRLPG